MAGEVFLECTVKLATSHRTENVKQILPEMKLRGLIPNFLIHVSVSDLYIFGPIVRVCGPI